MVSHSSHIVTSTKGEIINENVCHCIFTLMFDFVVHGKFSKDMLQQKDQVSSLC